MIITQTLMFRFFIFYLTNNYHFLHYDDFILVQFLILVFYGLNLNVQKINYDSYFLKILLKFNYDLPNGFMNCHVIHDFIHHEIHFHVR